MKFILHTHARAHKFIYLFIYLELFMDCLRKFSVNLDQDVAMRKKIGQKMNWQDI